MNKPSTENKLLDKTAIAVVVITGIFGLITIWLTHCLDGNKKDGVKKDQEQIAITNSPVNQVTVSSNLQKDTIVVVKNYPKSNNNETKRKEKEKSSLPENKKPYPEASLNKSLQNYSSKVIDDFGKGVSNVEIYCPNCLTKEVFTKQDGSFDLQGNFSELDAFWVSELKISNPKTTITKTIDWRDQSPQTIKFKK